MNTDRLIETLQQSGKKRLRVAITDIDGVLRGKLMHLDKFISATQKGFGFCDVVFGWDMADVAYDFSSVTGWHSGYPDAAATLDLTSYRILPWEDQLPFFLADFHRAEEPIASVCPRTLLSKVVQEGKEMGLFPWFSQEFEWFNFSESPDSLREKGHQAPRSLTPGMFGYSILRAAYAQGYVNDLFDHFDQAGLPLEGLHTETGPGVYEAAIQAAPLPEAADRAVIFKTGVKEIAYRHQILASFMAKWSPDYPGCGGHIHQSLWDASYSQNLFAAEPGPNEMSPLMEQYIAGQLHCLPYITPMLAPNINSYKRLVEGAWAPTTLTWGIDNRTTALRAITGHAASTRLETRVPGADVNPYLAMAACLASGLYGIREKLALPFAATRGNGYQVKDQGKLPPDLETATAQMKNSPLARQLFGEVFVDHFCMTREWECRQYAQAITDWELQRYFEII